MAQKTVLRNAGARLTLAGLPIVDSGRMPGDTG
jgi:hypothetical protein